MSKFNISIGAGCTFCTISKNLPVEKETILHLFYYCPTTNNLIDQWIKKYCKIQLPEPTRFFTAAITPDEGLNSGFQTATEILLYTIWQYKLQKKVPSAQSFNTDVDYYFSSCLKASHKLWEQIFNNRLFRHYGDE